MAGSLRLGSVFGIPVFMHWTFLLLVGFIALSQLVATGSVLTTIGGVVLIGLIFVCVVLHEFGHALAARSFGIETRDVTLLPIGGVARLERMPDNPRQEMLVALAGPAVNVVIAGMLGFWWFLSGGSLVAQLLMINLAMIVFNMIPAFPMDGGRVLRSFLARRIGHLRATDIAARIGRGIAVLFGVAGLLWSPMLILIAVFVWFGAGQERALARQKAIFDSGPHFGRRIYRIGPWLVYRDERFMGD